MSIQMPNPENPGGIKPDLSPIIPRRIIIFTLIGMLSGFLIGRYTSSSTSQIIPLFEGKYVEAQIINQAKPADKLGLLLLNHTSSNGDDKFMCLYRFDSTKRLLLEDKIKVQVGTIDGIPIATSIKEIDSDVETLDIQAVTELNESNSHVHHRVNPIHIKAHFKPTISAGYSTYTFTEGSSTYEIQDTSPLYSKAQALYQKYSAFIVEPKGLEVFITKNITGDAIIDLDNCHMHNGIVSECIHNLAN